MPCDSSFLPQQTPAQRMQEIREKMKNVDKLLSQKRIGVKVGPQGAITFTGLSTTDRGRMTDGCIYRRIMQTGSTTAKLAIQRAEQIAGVQVNKKIVAQGIHSHDNGASWHARG